MSRHPLAAGEESGESRVESAPRPIAHLYSPLSILDSPFSTPLISAKTKA